jgi:putative ABC transport system permease protein
MEEILLGKLIATSSRQIGMFLVILAVVSAAIVASSSTPSPGEDPGDRGAEAHRDEEPDHRGHDLQQAVALGVLGS